MFFTSLKISIFTTGVHIYCVLFLQLIDITGKDQDESMIALHDSNGDLNRAINVLLEGSPDTVSTN